MGIYFNKRSMYLGKYIFLQIEMVIL